jgi:hypothetical protein
MNDLQTRISEYVDGTVPPLDIELLVEELTETGEATRRLRLPATPSRWQRRRWVPVLTGLVVALLFIGGAALLLGPDDPPVITTPDQSIPVPTTSLPTPTTTPVLPIGAEPWTRIDIPGGTDLVASTITPAGPGFIAAGNTFTQGEVWARGQIWWSGADGTWTAVSDDEGTLFAEGHFPVGSAASNAAVIVWGSNNRQGGTVIWRSIDGAGWTLVSTGEPPLDGNYATKGLALDSGGFILYGAPDDCIIELDVCTPADLPRILVSADGIDWDPVTTPITFTAIVQTGSGDLLAAQRRASEPTVWVSQDEGSTWQRHSADHSIDTSTPSSTVETMTVTPHGLVAAGVTADKRPMLWISEDGTSFTETLALPAGGRVESIAHGRDWIVAVGSEGGLPLPWAPAVWTSLDGRNWQRVSLDGSYLGDGGLSDVAYRNGTFVAVGQHRAEIGGEAFTLHWSPPVR